MSYFRTEAERLHLALSSDGVVWRALNGNRPLLDRVVRDPFLYRGVEGLFHLVGTKGFGGAPGTDASDSILHAVSDDLVTWRGIESILVMKAYPGTLNCWAPEVFRDVETGADRLVWSSTVPGRGRETDPYGYDYRIWGCATSDWRSFSEPELFFDPGYNVIDVCVVRRPEGGYLMAFKDERGANEQPTEHKAIRIATADRVDGPWAVREPFVTPPMTEGPTLFRAGGEWRLLYDLFLDERFGCAASHDGLEWREVADVALPDRPRHASVIEIEDALGERLEAAFR